MITRLHIKNFAIIDEVELDIGRGLTVLTGETGAGKSILVDALGMALGDRSDAGAVRHGQRRAEIGVTVDVSRAPEARAWLDEQALESDDECLLRRVIGADGRSRAFINGQAVPLSSLRALGERLVDIHGQHAHQSLARADTQRRLLDHHGGLQETAERMRLAWDEWQQACRELDAVATANDDADARVELLRYQADELDAFAIAEGEYERLAQEHSRLSHASRLVEGSHEALSVLYENEHAAHALLARTLQTLERLETLDGGLQPAVALLREAEINTKETAEFLRSYSDNLEIDPALTEQVEERLQAARELARKHRVEPERLHAVLAQLQAQLHELDGARTRVDGLRQRVTEKEAICRALADGLHVARREAAAAFATEVTAAMQTLGMRGGRLEVEVVKAADERLRAHGLDNVSFLVSTNPGQPTAALARVASGGELSRISLAIQVVAADGSPIPCMVFDEVDTGVGGGVAEIVGRRLRELGAHRQVMCVTHLPQVASQGHGHLRVTKLSDGDSTRTVITPLTGSTRVEEIARMLGGVDITERTRAHAEEMLAIAGGAATPKSKKRRKKASQSS